MTLPSWSCTLPMPIGVNALYVNRGKAGMKGRMISPAYIHWRINAEGCLWKHKPLPSFIGPIGICIAIEEPKRAVDLDGKAKGILDLLVRHNIIEDDSSKFVRMLLMTWDKSILGAKVTVSQMEP